VQCNLGSDCPSLGYGLGSLCTSNHTCQCRQTNSANLIKNPGFDNSFADWTRSTCLDCDPHPVLFDASKDADNCTASGSLSITNHGFGSGQASQCVPIQPKTDYYFGFQSMQADTTTVDAVQCSLEQYAGSTCSGSSLDYVTVSSGDPANGNWHSSFYGMTSLDTAGSILINCGHFKFTTMTWLDQIYLNPNVATF
jgi:hypothetical protein